MDKAALEKIIGRKLTGARASNANSVLIALDRYGGRFGLDQPHREAQFFAQLLHESGGLQFDREIWGPTAQQKKYDTGALAKKLGNTPAADGDGKLRAGKGPLQVTGGSNEKQFTAWARAFDPSAPDFYKTPEAINTDPWEGLSAIWYWDTRGLNRYADEGDTETITVKINGGKNGLADRFNWFARVALVMLGYGPNEVAKFQQANGLDADGDAGPRTRSALHMALTKLTPAPVQSPEVKPAPVVVDTETKVPTMPKTVEKSVSHKFNWLTTIFGAGGIGATGLAWLKDADWQTVALIFGGGAAAVLVTLLVGVWAVNRIKAIRTALET